MLIPPLEAQTALPSTLGETGENTVQNSDPLPENLSRHAIKDVISRLNDTQVRELLIRELEEKVEQRERELAALSPKQTFGDLLSGWATALGQSFLMTVYSVEKIPAALIKSYAVFTNQRGNTSLWRVPGTLIFCLFSGLAAAYFASRLIQRKRKQLLDQQPVQLWGQIVIVSMRFFFQTLHLLVFVVAAYTANSIFNSSTPVDSSVVRYIIEAVSWTAFSVLVAKVILSPNRADLRLCSIDDKTAKFLTWRTGLVFGWSSFFVVFPFWLKQFDWPLGETRLGFWIGMVFYGLISLTFWQARKGITQMVLGNRDNGATWRRFAESWPMISITLVAFQWLIIEVYIATGNVANLSPTAMSISLAVLMMMPLLELSIHAIVGALWPINPDDKPILQTAHKQAQAGLVRFGRVLVAIVLVLVFSLVWDVSLQDLASENVGARFARESLSIFFIALIAYGLWEVLNIVTDREIAIERVTMGMDGEQSDSEGGLGGTRLGTLMPLVRGIMQTIIAVMATLAILGQLGINVTPLLAGAGVVGLAVGFGAQTLVKDIFSGMFFLIDDAFRKGEYIDLGTVKGVVEKISIRSMQLRHHNGPLNTVPFGEIHHLSNFSRDWVVMKLPLRLTYDTDGNKVRKMIKNLGKELLKHPDIGDLFLDPLKSQGVLAMEDSAMIMRIKFKTKPGDQFMVRRVVLDEIHKLFDANGIKFASREVTVRIADAADDKPLTTEEKQLAAAASSTLLEEGKDAEKVPPIR